MSVRVMTDRVASVLKNIHKMERARVYVGIPADENARSDDKVGNAGIGYIQEFGSPAKNIPARPFLIPGVKAVEGEVADLLADGARNVLEDRSIEASLTKAGIKATNSVKQTITKGEGFAALSETTLRARKRRGVSRTKPLIDTGQLRNSINYVVKGT
jgi:hypothetical protein